MHASRIAGYARQFNLVDTYWGIIRPQASAILAALPLVIVVLFFQRQIIKGIATTGFGGR